MRQSTQEILWKADRENAREIKVGGKLVARVLYKGYLEKPCAVVWGEGKAYKPIGNWVFRSKVQRYKYVREAIKHQKMRIEANERNVREQKKAIAEAVKNQNLQKGDLYVTSWGYDQTNYDYIAVIEVSPSGKTAICQRTSALHNGTSGQANLQEPIFCPFGEKFRLQVRDGYLTGSYPYCHTGEGSRRKGYFSKVEEGREYHETMSEFGH